MLTESKLRAKILHRMKSQGFKVNPHLHPKTNNKKTLRKLHQQSRNEKLGQHKDFILNNLDLIKEYSIDSKDINPENIDLELIEVQPESKESKLFFWWNLAWWSLPFERPIGRQMRFILWDKGHDAPFGLIGLQSPPLQSKVRDDFLGLKSEDEGYWINMSLYGQRIGALPPYNQLLGGKMVGLSLTSNELRDSYKEKYLNRKTRMRKRVIPSDLLFITTTSAFGKSSIYDRIKYNDEKVSQFLGMTSGSGTFHIPDDLFALLLKYLDKKDVNVERGYGNGPSRKLRLLKLAFEHLGVPQYSEHNVKRGIYLFPNVSNLDGVLHDDEKPKWYNRPVADLNSYWLDRWAIPRTSREEFKGDFAFKKFSKGVLSSLK